MTSKKYFVYILRNHSGTLYIGITNNLSRRVYEHKNKISCGFTQKYNITILIYYEIFNSVISAIEREKQLKKWNRKKKIHLIKILNPTLQELTLE